MKPVAQVAQYRAGMEHVQSGYGACMGTEQVQSGYDAGTHNYNSIS